MGLLFIGMGTSAELYAENQEIAMVDVVEIEGATGVEDHGKIIEETIQNILKLNYESVVPAGVVESYIAGDIDEIKDFEGNNVTDRAVSIIEDKEEKIYDYTDYMIYMIDLFD